MNRSRESGDNSNVDNTANNSNIIKQEDVQDDALFPQIDLNNGRGVFDDKLSYNLTSQDDLEEIKFLLNSRLTEVGIPFNTNILRIALNLKEESIA